MCRATGVEPTKETPSIPGCSRSALTESWPPLTRLTTPGGSPTLSRTSKVSSLARGSCSDGLRMIGFPHAMANGKNHMGTMKGKLNGVIAAKTPIGWRIMSESIPRETSSRFAPCMSEGMPVATSTHSIPRRISPAASLAALPLSFVTSSARSFLRSSRRYLNSKQARARSSGGVARQPGNASRAARTARSTSAGPESGTSASTSPVAGLVTGSRSLASASVHAPPT